MINLEHIKHYYRVGVTLKPSKFFGYATIISIEGDGYEVYTDFGNIFNITWDDIVAEHIEPIGVFEWDGKYCMHPVMPIKERFTLQMGNMANVWARLAELGLLEE